MKSLRIFSPKKSPIRNLDLCTDISSIVESGLEKYTYSKRQGWLVDPFIGLFLSTFPCSSIITTCPGFISLSNSYPIAVIALLSDAIKYEFLYFPKDKGLIPFVSLKATKPIPATIITTA